MMALASRCIAALAPRGPVAAPLQLLLAHCHARLGANLAKWVEAQRAAVEAYGARLAGAGSEWGGERTWRVGVRRWCV